MATNRPKVVFYPNEEIHEKLKKESEKRDLSVSKVIQQIIQEYFKNKETENDK